MGHALAKTAPKGTGGPTPQDASTLAHAALAELGLSDVGTASVLGASLDLGAARALGGLRSGGAADGNGAGGLVGRELGRGGGGDALDIGGLRGNGKRGEEAHAMLDLCRGGSECKKGAHAVVENGPVSLKGALTRDEIQRVMQRHLKQMQHCYERELPRSPELEGKLATVFTIGPSGDVTSASSQQNTLHDEAVERCVLRVMRRMRFPAPRGGGQVLITYPLVFSTAGR